MARRTGGSSRSSAFGRGRSPSPSPTRSRAAPPPPQPKAVSPQPATQVGQPMMASSPGGGLMANVASTAAGVAIGHTVGHALTGALGIGGGGHNSEPVPIEQPQAQQSYGQPQQQLSNQDTPCKFELEQFLACAQNQSNDLQLCDGFNQVLNECKMRYGNMYQ